MPLAIGFVAVFLWRSLNCYGVCLHFQTSGNSLCVFIVPTYTEGKPPPGAAWFCKWLEEASNDFRVDKELLKGMKFAVFGLGNSQYGDHFNEVSHYPYWYGPYKLKFSIWPHDLH
jgi:hypothetical protein